MDEKTYLPEGEVPPSSQIGASLEALASTIAARRGAGEGSYTFRLLSDESDLVLKKIVEEAGEVALAAKDADAARRAWAAHAAMPGVPEQMKQLQLDKSEQATDHLRYEVGDVFYHLLVLCERYGVRLDELAAELNSRMTQDEAPEGGIRLREEHINRGR
jgi:phosphoribosyl-ATP pyrophosphohydrolase/phosphoribosyl-ATP pyrophosphohydrolase/phosphoribosyl-AMP cyclohydrolase